MLARIHGVAIDLDVDAVPGAGNGGAGNGGGGERDLTILRIAHEALHNALHHAHAERVTVHLSERDERVTVEVSDDGIGFDPAGADARSRHLGLTSMEERARELGGELRIHSAPGAGTTVRVEVAA